MISNNRLGWFATALLSATLTLGLGACGDDGNDTGGPTPDAAATPDACIGHTCPAPEGALTLPEGGLFRTELFHVGTDPTDGTRAEILGSWLFAFTDNTTEPRAFFGPQVITGDANNPTNCWDQRAGTYFTIGYSPENQAVADARTYYDLGDSIVATGSNGSSLNMTKYTDTADPTNNLTHDIIYLADFGSPDALGRNESYTLPVVPPRGDFPGLDLFGGVDVTQGTPWTDPPAMYMPSDFTMQAPTEQEFFNNGDGVTLDASGDVTFTYEYADTKPDGWPGYLHFTSFGTFVDHDNDPNTDPVARLSYACMAPATGTMTIPAALFAQPDFPANGMIIHGTFAHTAWYNSGRRWDFMGVNCNFTKLTVNNIPAN